MRISILTLFPEMFAGPLQYSILKAAQEKQLVEIALIQIREFGIGKHKVVDDTPYGGGVGMVMRVDVLHDAIERARKHPSTHTKVILLSAKGSLYSQKKATELLRHDHIILVCGHYEGVDERILEFVDEELSIGEYILTGGEIPAMVITDSVIRLIEGVLKPDATSYESYSLLHTEKGSPLLEYPHYTRPFEYNGVKVPEILLSGNHKQITEWRMKQAVDLTKKRTKDKT